jgi:hypothetical protein
MQCIEMAVFAEKHAPTRLNGRPRSGPELYRAEPVCCVVRGVRPCASQARLGLWGRHLGEGHRRLASMANVRVTAGLDELLSLVTFFAAAKKVTPAPGRGSADRPTRNQDFINSGIRRKNLTSPQPSESHKPYKHPSATPETSWSEP